MNALLAEIRRSLVELAKGLDGQLNMSDAMEDLSSALAKNEVSVGLCLPLCCHTVQG